MRALNAAATGAPPYLPSGKANGDTKRRIALSACLQVWRLSGRVRELDPSHSVDAKGWGEPCYGWDGFRSTCVRSFPVAAYSHLQVHK